MGIVVRGMTETPQPIRHLREANRRLHVTSTYHLEAMQKTEGGSLQRAVVAKRNGVASRPGGTGSAISAVWP